MIKQNEQQELQSIFIYQSPVIETLSVELEQPVLTGSAPDMSKEDWA